jgi:hypothetical protein
MVEIDGTIHNGDNIEATAIRTDGAPVPAAASTTPSVPDAQGAAEGPSTGTPGADDRPEHETPGPVRREGEGSKDRATPAIAGEAGVNVPTQPADDRATPTGGDGHEIGTPVGGATAMPGGESHSGTPQSTEPASHPESTAKPATTAAPEPSERPASSPQRPEPREDH